MIIICISHVSSHRLPHRHQLPHGHHLPHDHHPPCGHHPHNGHHPSHGQVRQPKTGRIIPMVQPQSGKLIL